MKDIINKLKLIIAIAVASLCCGQELIAQGSEPTEVSGQSEISIAPRELIILKSSIDSVWGSSIVAVINKSKGPQEFSFLVNIPKETSNFQPAEGVEKKDINLSENGVLVKKSFQQGINVVGIAFNVQAKNGEVSLSFKSPRALPELILMTPSGLLKVTSNELELKTVDVQESERYDVYVLKSPVTVGQEIKIQLTGIPLGRSNLWWTGSIFAFILTAAAGFFAFKTRPILKDKIEVQTV